MVATIDVRRQDSESTLDYFKRIINGKLVDKTLAEYDYSELAELIYGKAYSSDFARRMMYGSKRVLDVIEDEMVAALVGENKSDVVIDDIVQRTAEMRRERQRLSDQRREYHKILNSEGRYDNLCDRLVDAAFNLDETVGKLIDGDPVYVQLSENEGILFFSDWHYGMETQNVFNKFNRDICKERVKYVVSRAEEKLQLHLCRKLHVVVLGDLVHGGIHTSARVASEELVCDQLMQVSEILAQAIIDMSRYVEEVSVHCTYGNHARTVQNKNDSIHRDNMERIIPWWLEQRFQAYDNIDIVKESENEFIFIDACGHDICATHGDLDSVKCAPRLLTTLFHKQYGKDIEYIVLGDKHHRESFDELGVTAAICGSLCGTDDHANGKRLYSSPEQMLLIVTPECGVDAEYRIKCK